MSKKRNRSTVSMKDDGVEVLFEMTKQTEVQSGLNFTHCPVKQCDKVNGLKKHFRTKDKAKEQKHTDHKEQVGNIDGVPCKLDESCERCIDSLGKFI